MSTPPYYSKSNLIKWSALVSTAYNPTTDKKNAEWLKSNFVPQLDYWAKTLLSKLPGYSISGRRDWLDRDRKRFRHYMWLRLLPADHHPDLYFTIGIDNDAGDESPGLVIKIDFQRSGAGSLSTEQKKYLEKKLVRKNGGPAWHGIDPEKINTWEKLFAECLTFINKYEGYYSECLSGIRDLSDSYRISRICWNSNGWVKPSGRIGKSPTKESHEGKFGYGHEEWLFDTSKLIDSYHYAFLEPILKGKGIYDGSVLDIGLYSIEGKSGKRYWIGKILKVGVIDATEAERIKNIYKKNGWYGEMKKQISASGADSKKFNTWTGGQLFNIRFKPENMRIEEYQLLPQSHPIYTISRYTFLKNIDLLNSFSQPPSQEFKARNGEPSEDENANSGYEREPRFIQVGKKHKKIQKILLRKLREEFGKENVTWEHPLNNGTQVDIARKDGDKIIYYEIKTYPSIRISLREALGQLLEYALWTEDKHPSELIIVTDLPIGDGKKYLKALREGFNLPINYQRLDPETSMLFPSEF